MGGLLLPFVFALEIAGLVLIGHALHKSGTSGQEVHSGQVQTGTRFRTLDLALDPSMDPLSFGFDANVSSYHLDRNTSMTQGFAYRLTLSREGRAVMTRNVEFSIRLEEDKSGRRSAPPRSVHAGFEWPKVPAAGNYQLAMAWLGGQHPEALYNMNMRVRRNVEGVVMKKIWWGVGLILFGGLVHFLFKPATLQENER